MILFFDLCTLRSEDADRWPDDKVQSTKYKDQFLEQ